MTQYRSARRSRPRRTQRRSSVRFLMTFLLTTSMIATGGFGTFPENPITQTFQEEIGQNIPLEFLNPINSYLESLSAPTIQPQPVTESESDSPLDIVGLLFETIPVTQSAAPTELAISSEELTSTLSAIQTDTALATTVTPVSTLTNTLIPTNTITPVASQTLTPTPVWTFTPPIIFPTSTRRPNPVNTITSLPSTTSTITLTATSTSTSTFTPTATNTATATATSTSTPTPTDTLTATPTPAALFNISAVNINGFATSPVVIPAGQTFFVAYNYNIWDDPCPGCITQLVTGLGTAGSHGGTCAFNGDAGLSPGTTSSENINLTAPLTPGTYNIVVVSNWQANCTDALNAYPGGSPPQTIGQITVP